MSSPPADQPWPGDADRQIRDAQNGADGALGAVLEGCRQYLLLVANEQLEADLRDKVGPSDLVQDTFLDAQRGFGRFHGATREELLAWLRRILLNNLADARCRYYAGKRDVTREVALGDAAGGKLAREGNSPEGRLAAAEQADSVRRALDQLPEASRQVIEWRNYELCTFAEVGRRLGKSEEAARKVWSRAVEQLEKLLEPPG